MKKKEIVIVAALAVFSLLALLLYKVMNRTQGSDYLVQIIHGDEVVVEFDPYIDAVYTIQGDYGTLDVEVKDHKWHVTNEQCPNHICASEGWIGVDEWFPIVCMPNGVIVIQKDTSK